MCGRYTLTTPAGMGLPDRFGVPDEPEEATLERYNVCPTEQIAVVREKEGERQVKSVRWGLVPSWAKALGKGREPINARSETVSETKTFADEHPYWSEPAPQSMLIDEVEAIWATIAERDDWRPLSDKIAAIRRMGEALGEPPAPAGIAA